MCTYGHLYMSVWVELPKQRWSLQSRAAGRKTDIIMELFDMHTDMLSLSHTHTHTHTQTEAPDTPSWCRPCTSQGAAGARWRQKHITAERLRSQRPLSPLYSTQHCSPPAETQRSTVCVCVCVCVCVRAYQCAWICLCERRKKSLFFVCLSKIYPTEILMWLQQTHVEKKAMYYLKIASFMWRSPHFYERKKYSCLFLILVFPYNYIDYNIILKNWCFECLATMARLVTCNPSLFLSHWYFAKGIDGLILTNWCFCHDNAFLITLRFPPLMFLAMLHWRFAVSPEFVILHVILIR